jgi:hypothetical protein
MSRRFNGATVMQDVPRETRRISGRWWILEVHLLQDLLLGLRGYFNQFFRQLGRMTYVRLGSATRRRIHGYGVDVKGAGLAGNARVHRE